MCVIRCLAIGIIVVIGASLAVGALLFNDELLARVRVDLVHLRQLLLLLGSLELLSGLLLLVLFQAFLTLIARQLAVVRAFGHALRLGTTRCVRVAGTFRGDSVRAACAALGRSLTWLVAAGSASGPQVGRLDLSVDRIFVLAGGVVCPDTNLASIVLMVCRASIAEHVHVRTTVRVVFLPIVRCKLVLVLQEAVLVTLRASRAIADVAGHVATRTCGCPCDTPAAFTGRIDFEQFGSALVHMRCAGVVIALAPCRHIR